MNEQIDNVLILCHKHDAKKDSVKMEEAVLILTLTAHALNSGLDHSAKPVSKIVAKKVVYNVKIYSTM